MWTDELYVVWEARQPLGALFDPQLHIHHPPGYRLALHAWMGLGGTSEWWVRLLSALAGVALIGVLWGLARELWPGHGWAAGAAALFAATSPFLVHYSQDATSYSWAALWVSLSFLLLVKAWRADRTWLWVGWMVSLAVAVYSHYFALFPLFIEGIAVLLAGLTRLGGIHRTERLRRVRHALMAIGGAILLFAPWAWRLLAEGGRALQQVFYLPSLDAQPLGWLPTLLAGYSHDGFWLSWLGKLLAWGGVAGAFLWGIRRLWRARLSRIWVGIALVLGWGLAATAGPYLFLRLTTPPDAITPPRFAAMAAPALLLGLGALLGALPRVGRAVLLLGWLVASSVQLYGEYTAPPRQDWRGIMGVVAREGLAGDAMLAFTAFHAGAAAAYYPVPVAPEGGWFAAEGGVMGEAAYWLRPGWRWRGFLDTDAYRSADFGGEIEKRIGGAQRLWYLAGDGTDGTYPPGPGAERALDQAGFEVVQEWRASPLVLRLLTRPPRLSGDE